MIKIRTFIEVEIKGREYSLLCSSDSPIDDALEANALINSYLLERKKLVEQKPADPQEVEQE